MYWLFKTEPGDYSYDDLVREKQTAWTGVNNAQAKNYLRKVMPGDEILIYHTGKERAIVGVAGAVVTSYDSDHGETIVEISPKYALRRSVSLKQVKAVTDLSDWELVRLPRLSVMPVTAEQWYQVMQMAAAPEGAGE